jgi:uncharacterized protein with GYD domain
MPFFLYQWVYKDPAIQAMVRVPQDRQAELRKVTEAFGGKLHQFFLCFGEYDGLAVVEFPDREACAACSLTLSAAGGNAHLRTTALITASEAQEAMHRARSVHSGYRAPLGYNSHG